MINFREKIDMREASKVTYIQFVISDTSYKFLV